MATKCSLFLLPFDLIIRGSCRHFDEKHDTTYEAQLDKLYDDFQNLGLELESELDSVSEDVVCILRALTATTHKEYFDIQLMLKALLHDITVKRDLERKKNSKSIVCTKQLNELRTPKLKPFKLKLTGLKDWDELVSAWKEDCERLDCECSAYVEMSYDEEEELVEARVYIDFGEQNAICLFDQIDKLLDIRPNLKDSVLDAFLACCSDVQVYNDAVEAWLPAE